MSAIRVEMSASKADQDLLQVISVKKRGVPESQNVDRVTELVYQGADVNRPFQSVASVKALLRRPTIMGTLIRHGANVTSPKMLIDGKNVLMLAVEDGNVAVVREILRNGRMNLESKTADGSTAIMMAATRGVLENIEMLLGAGANLYKKDNAKNGVLHYAARSGSKDMIRYLLTKGANPNQTNALGETPLMVVVDAYIEGNRRFDLEVLKELALVTDLAITDNRGMNVWTRVMEDTDEETADDVKREILQVFKNEIEHRMKNLLLVQKTMADVELPDDILMKISTMGLHDDGVTEHMQRKLSARTKLNTKR